MKSNRGISIPIVVQRREDVHTRRLPLPKKVVLPTVFSWGRLSSVVAPGAAVRGGQIIAEDRNGLIPPLRASVSGRVSEMGPWTYASGEQIPSIVIESDGVEAVEKLFEGEPPGSEPMHILQAISASGVREVDPSAWPLGARIGQPALTPPILLPFAPDLRRPIEFLILNGMDREPGIFLRSHLLAEREDEFFESIPLLKKVTGAATTVLAIAKGRVLPGRFERNLERAGVHIVRCPDKYPMALQQNLVRQVTGSTLPQPAGDARAAGTVVLDIQTVLRIREAVLDGSPAVEAVVQVSVPNRHFNDVVSCREGMLLGEMLGHLPPMPENTAKIIVGGPLMGHAQHDLQVPLTQQTDSIFVLTADEISRFSPEACMNCGFCVRHCPVKLLPNELSKYCEYGQFDRAEKNDLFACIECGICAYVCPVKRPMVHLLRFGKHEVMTARGMM